MTTPRSDPRRWLRRRLAGAASAVLLLAGCGSDGPASYVGSASNAAVYVSWTRSGDSIDGQLTLALLSDEASSGEVKSSRASFTGTASGSSVSLAINEGLGTTSTITGTLKDGTLVLSYPGADGGVTPITLREGDAADYNAELDALRGKAADAKEQADADAQEAQAVKDGTTAADAVRSAIASLDQAADNATASNRDQYAADLDTIRADLDTAKSTYEVVTQDIENGYNDTICDDAASLGDDVASMKHDIGSMHGDRAQNRNAASIASDITALRTRFAEFQAIDPQYRPEDAPTKADVDAAITAARAKVRRQGGQGANFSAAQQLLGQAQALKAKADAACARLGK